MIPERENNEVAIIYPEPWKRYEQITKKYRLLKELQGRNHAFYLANTLIFFQHLFANILNQ